MSISIFFKSYFIETIKKNPTLNYFQNRAGRLSLGEDARPQYSCADADGTKCGNMLNTDWEVLYNMPLNEDNFLSECDLSAATTDCEKSDTYDLSVSYSEVNLIFHSKNSVKVIEIFLNGADDFGFSSDNIYFFLFLQDNDKWLEDYAAAYDVMTANGASSLTEISS